MQSLSVYFHESLYEFIINFNGTFGIKDGQWIANKQ